MHDAEPASSGRSDNTESTTIPAEHLAVSAFGRLRVSLESSEAVGGAAPVAPLAVLGCVEQDCSMGSGPSSRLGIAQ